jgi:hypothetical protein
VQLLYILLFLSLWSIVFIWIKLRLNPFIYLKSIRNKQQQGIALVTYLIRSDYQQNSDIPKYKFFSSLVEELIRARKLYGCEIESIILEIRKYLRIDIKESKKIKESVFGGAFQYIVISIFTWGFIYATYKLIHIQINFLDKVALICFQVFGLILYYTLAQVIERKSFNILNSYFFSIYNFRSLFSISRPISEIISIVKIDSLPDCKDLSHIKERMFILITELKEKGRLNTEDLNQMIYETWDCFEIKLERFQKLILTLKLLSMAMFVLPSFLAVMFLLMSKLHV